MNHNRVDNWRTLVFHEAENPVLFCLLNQRQDILSTVRQNFIIYVEGQSIFEEPICKFCIIFPKKSIVCLYI